MVRDDNGRVEGDCFVGDSFREVDSKEDGV